MRLVNLVSGGVVAGAVLAPSPAVAIASPTSGPGTVCGVVTGQAGGKAKVTVTRGRIDCGVALSAASKVMRGEVQRYDPTTNTFSYEVAGMHCGHRKTPSAAGLPKSWMECTGPAASLRLDPYNPSHQPRESHPCWDDICRFV